ncbi:hypothetical protein TRFO_05989 [Tritrichomonas foetus]|uniref:Uncharacterized protein n=1 Tax=Tritrichomonas foetus TaxID=1144522 RepID=A0A1J4K7J5_9EUKA|nr:hypothetical protein TRFO_05989 [Tritrichomonas foetus]|eukprot:OHT05389.1 hypothetical protein TRFO_05989 [Tritrichomonas foetus]
MDNQDVATTTFTYLAVEDQIHTLWKEISAVREQYTESQPIKDWEILRLMEVHNQLDIESTRQQESHLKSLIDSLKLSEINAKGIITGGLKARIQPLEVPKKTFSVRSQSEQVISQMGFVDPLYGVNDEISLITSQTSTILIDRKREITKTLILLNHKYKLTYEEEELKKNLLAELRSMNTV